MYRTHDRYEVVADTRTATARLWIGRDRRHGDYLSDCAVKVPGGLRTLVTRWRRPPTARVVEIATLKGGALSPRPYQLAQACDGSTTDCALALFEDFCTARRLEPAALLKEAYPEDAVEPAWSLPNRRRLREAAAWEGVAYPETWDAAAVRGLVETLHEINYHALAAIVAAVPVGGVEPVYSCVNGNARPYSLAGGAHEPA
jgi:hypothetical protein